MWQANKSCVRWTVVLLTIACVVTTTAIGELCYKQNYATPDFVGCEVGNYALESGMACPGGPWTGDQLTASVCSDYYSANSIRNGTSLVDEPGFAEMDVGEDPCYTFNDCGMHLFFGPPIHYTCIVDRTSPLGDYWREQHAQGGPCPSTGG